MTGRIDITLSVSFDYDEKRTSFEEAAGVATSLAVRPNYSTIEEGVQLTDHEVCGVVDDFNQCEIEIR